MDLCAALASSMGAEQVPFVVFLNPQGVKIFVRNRGSSVFLWPVTLQVPQLRIDALAGADPPRLVEKVKILSSKPMEAAWPFLYLFFLFFGAWLCFADQLVLNRSLF